jgi:outer membrane protein OmpA-like peptidoglycan-associated protein
VRVELHEFSERDGNLNIVYTVHLSERAIARHQGMSLTPGLEAGNNVLLLPSFVVAGPNKERVLTRHHRNNRLEMPEFDADWRNATSIPHRVSVPFQSWMSDARLVIHREVQGFRAQSVFNQFLLANQPEIAPRATYQVRPRVEMIVPAREAKILDRTGQAFLDFPVGQSVIQPAFRRNPVELSRIEQAVQDVINNPDAQLNSIDIQGFASPEGAAASNHSLSGARATALQNHLRTRFNLPVTAFRVSAGGEDWDGLVAQLNENRVHVPQRDRILQAIASEFDLDRRERAVRATDNDVSWNVMLRELFPDLRRVDYRINYTIRDYTLEDAVNLIDSAPDNLSHYEMWQVAEHYGRGSERANFIIATLILRHFPNDELAHNNAAALHIQRGDLALARAHLERAGASAAALNNRGVIALLEGDLTAADSYFVRAQAAGSEDAAHNRGEVERAKAP